MLIDNELRISYLNQAIIDLFKSHEGLLQKQWPRFQANKKLLLGADIDGLYQEFIPEDKGFNLAEPTSGSVEVSLEHLFCKVTASPVYDQENELLGHCLEILDISRQREQELQLLDASAKIDAISKAQAVIEFNMDGTIISANDNFLQTLGYRLEEVQGKHHSMFVEPGVETSAEYLEFWQKLNAGEFESGEYKRLGKGGKEVWIQAFYNPVFDLTGKPVKVVKFATDVTKQKQLNADFSGQIAAISKSQAVIEFNMALSSMPTKISCKRLVIGWRKSRDAITVSLLNPVLKAVANTRSFGNNSSAVNMSQKSISVSLRGAGKYGSRLLITLFLISTASLSRWLSSPPMLPGKN
ncbi:PAS domain-containing protein [Thalassomonas haliotis]|uniref:PAS domain-containing protein n=1 Tax=Thalassomonas haliotis TaxID=485448 RepID=A0ABY7VMS6_9GAMM|nr:PAS domain-containing protein [Thalassomonas haliotis]